VLAETIDRYRIVADLHDLSDDERKRDADALVDYLLLDPGAEATLRKAMQGRGYYVILATNVDETTAHDITSAQLYGALSTITLELTPVRAYPEAGGAPGTSLAAQVLGFVNSAGVGQYGLEQRYDKILSGRPEVVSVDPNNPGQIYITTYGDTLKDAEELTKSIEAILEAQLVYVKPAIFKSEQGFNSSLPLANDELDVGTSMNSAPLSTTFPFVSSTLSDNRGILYGINRHNNSLIIFDRFSMENANMVVFAKSGAGKSYTIKLETLRSLMLGINVIIIDPENEYKHLCDAVGGTFIKISLNSPNHLNPFDLPKVGEDEDPEDILRNNTANLIGLLHIMLGSVTPEEDSVLDRAVRETYSVRDITAQSNWAAFTPEAYPTMSDLYQILRSMDGGENLAIRLEKYTEGIFSGFLNNTTNVKVDNQLMVFNLRDMEEELRPIAMYVVLQFIWNEMRTNMTKRLVLVDEAWVMMKYDDAASFLFGIAKRFRKYYTGLTTTARVRLRDGAAKTYRLDREYNIAVPVQLAPHGVTWVLVE